MIHGGGGVAGQRTQNSWEIHGMSRGWYIRHRGFQAVGALHTNHDRYVQWHLWVPPTAPSPAPASSCDRKETLTENNSGRKGLIHSHFWSQSIPEGTHSRAQDMNPNHKPCRNVALPAWPLAVSQSLIFSWLFVPRNGPALSGLGPSTSMNNQDNVPQMCLQTNLMESVPRPRFLLPGDSRLNHVDN